jgi:hypothetical protein
MSKCYIHHIPGRLRIRIPALKNNPQGIERVKEMLSFGGIDSFNGNSLTGSVTITYDPTQVDTTRLLDILKENNLYSENRISTMDSQLRQASHATARKISRAMFGWAVGRVLEANGLSFIAAFI